MIFDSANGIIPHLLRLVDVKSVIDIGCGPGEWRSKSRQCGITDVVGYDGELVDKTTLHFPKELFFTADVKEPIDAGRKFDLGVSLEVAEHLLESALNSSFHPLPLQLQRYCFQPPSRCRV